MEKKIIQFRKGQVSSSILSPDLRDFVKNVSKHIVVLPVQKSTKLNLKYETEKSTEHGIKV